MRRGLFVLIILSAPFLASNAFSDPEECEQAVSQYKSAASDVDEALQSYATCVSDSRGHDDCSSEFSSLQSAQSDFESAVSAYGTDCQ